MSRLRTPSPWPWPVPEVSLPGSPGADYPLGVDRETALRWVWRVRHWTYTVSAALSQTATWTWSDPHLAPPAGTGPAAFSAVLSGSSLTRPSPDLDTARSRETVLLARAAYNTSQIASGSSAGSHLDGLAGSYSTPFTSASRPLAGLFDLQVAFMDPYWPYATPAVYAPPLIHNTATDLYYPRLLVYAAASAGLPTGALSDPLTQPTIPSVPFTVGASVALATPGRAFALSQPGADNWPLTWRPARCRRSAPSW